MVEPAACVHNHACRSYACAATDRKPMLPAEDGIEAPPPIPAPRGPAPSWVKVVSPGAVTLYFDFDNDFFSLHVTVALTNLAKHVADTKASPVDVTGFRAATRLSNGQLMSERDAIGSIRARKVADTLAGLGVPAGAIAVSASPQAQPADGATIPGTVASRSACVSLPFARGWRRPNYARPFAGQVRLRGSCCRGISA
jgi:hypothetical protein